MRYILLISGLLSILAGCSSDNPVSATNDTLQLDSLRVTFSIPKASYGVSDTLVATTTVYNPKNDTVRFAVFNCNAVAWTVDNASGKTLLSSPPGPNCNSLSMYSILPHQSRQIIPLSAVIPIRNFAGAQTGSGSYSLNADDRFGNFSLKFSVN